jgi:hypothetical protein
MVSKHWKLCPQKERNIKKKREKEKDKKYLKRTLQFG